MAVRWSGAYRAALEKYAGVDITICEIARRENLSQSGLNQFALRNGYRERGGCNNGAELGREIQRQRAIDKLAEKAKNDSDGTVELFEYIDHTHAIFRCKECGTVFKRTSVYARPICCPTCREAETVERKAQREQERLDRERERAEELAKDKNCKVCGCVFHSEIASRVFCSKECAKKDKIRKKNEREKRKTAKKQAEEIKKEKVCKCCGAIFHSTYATRKLCDECQTLSKYCDHKLRALKYGVEYDPSVKLDKLIERDSNICQICGFPCDRSDNRWSEKYGPLSPTIDHIIAMVNGGGHTWENVQLAHAICNSVKRDLGSDELTDEVISYAEEQALGYKFA